MGRIAPIFNASVLGKQSCPLRVVEHAMGEAARVVAGLERASG
jgi:hypothetical protein